MMVAVFISGAVAMALATLTLFFLRFWVRTKDPFFAIFAFAFFLLMLERWVRLWIGPGHETQSVTVYLIRLAAFIIIIAAVIHKNRATSLSPRPG